jgi:glucosylceramidase
MKLAQKVSKHKIKLLGTPWSPPIWMKDIANTKVVSLKGPVGGEYYQIFADYFVK